MYVQVRNLLTQFAESSKVAGQALASEADSTFEALVRLELNANGIVLAEFGRALERLLFTCATSSRTGHAYWQTV